MHACLCLIDNPQGYPVDEMVCPRHSAPDHVVLIPWTTPERQAVIKEYRLDAQRRRMLRFIEVAL